MEPLRNTFQQPCCQRGPSAGICEAPDSVSAGYVPISRSKQYAVTSHLTAKRRGRELGLTGKGGVRKSESRLEDMRGVLHTHEPDRVELTAGARGAPSERTPNRTVALADG